MQAAADGGDPSLSGDRNDGHHSIVSELAALIEHVQAGMKRLEAAIARESAPGNQDAGNVFVLDDVTPRYVKANAALNACNAGLGVALHCLLDARTAKPTISRRAIAGRFIRSIAPEVPDPVS